MRLPLAFAAVSALALAGPAGAISITATNDPTALQGALLGGTPGLTITSFTVTSLSGSGGELSTGTYTNDSGIYSNVPRGVVVSSGDVREYNDGPNTEQQHFGFDYGSAAAPTDNILLDPITSDDPNSDDPYPHFDVTRIDLTFDAAANVSDVKFTIVFGSEEYPDFVGLPYIDTFGIYFNDGNIAVTSGNVAVNVDHPSFVAMAGTELNGVIAPNGNALLVFDVDAAPGSTNNKLTFIVADTSDGILDTTVFISDLRSNVVPEPTTLALLPLTGLALAAARRRSRSL